MPNPLLTRQLIEKLKQDFQLDWNGIHGVGHWSRVRLNGLRLCESVEADRTVVELFSFLHDSKRQNDDHDPHHGPRAAEYIDTLLGQHIHLNDRQIEQLKFACSYHTHSKLTDDFTVMVCWDADRLDLGRVGINPDPTYLHTEAAKQIALVRHSPGSY